LAEATLAELKDFYQLLSGQGDSGENRGVAAILG
jgi:hypothetical protein